MLYALLCLGCAPLCLFCLLAWVLPRGLLTPRHQMAEAHIAATKARQALAHVASAGQAKKQAAEAAKDAGLRAEAARAAAVRAAAAARLAEDQAKVTSGRTRVAQGVLA